MHLGRLALLFGVLALVGLFAAWRERRSKTR
jgi:hypothetical protein